MNTFRTILLLLAHLSPALALAAPQPPADGYHFVVVFDRAGHVANPEPLVGAAGGRLLFWFPEIGIAVASADKADFGNSLGRRREIRHVGLTGHWLLPQAAAHDVTLTAPGVDDDLYGPHQWNIRRVGADRLWDHGVTGSHGTVMAIVDSGVDSDHPDLVENVVFRSCMQLAGQCDPDTVIASHGTHVAGIAAAAFGGGSVVGVGPNLGLASYQVFENAAFAYDPVIWWAILDAARQGFAVINLSLGAYSGFPQGRGDGAAAWVAWNRVIQYALSRGVTVVASAGNAGLSLNGPLYHVPSDIPGVINVAATGIRANPQYPQEGSWDVRSFFSNVGATVDIAAPGGDCGEEEGCTGFPPSAYPWYSYLILSTEPGGGYRWMGGTSMAAPHVAAAAALLLDENPALTPRQVKALLLRSAERLGDRQWFGAGMVDVAAAVTRAQAAGKGPVRRGYGSPR